MNRRIIKSVLSKKRKDFISSIEDKQIRKIIEKNSFITGGSIVSMLLKERVNDFDIYLTDFESVKLVTEYYVNKFIKLHPKLARKIEVVTDKDEQRVKIWVQSAGVACENESSEYEIETEDNCKEEINNILGTDDKETTKNEKEKYRPIFLTNNAITLSNKIQIIIRFYGGPEEVHKNFDFVHCTCYYKDDKLVLPANALESMITKNLYYVGSKYPITSFIRCRKFIKKGWHINAGQMLKICLQISELDLTNIDVLEDQLTGVDSYYFAPIISYLRQRKTKDKNFEITIPYLSSILDKMLS